MPNFNASSSQRPGFVSVSNYLTLPHNPATWLIKDLIPLSGAALIYGLPKTGKSAAAIQLAAAISGGEKEWLGFPIITRGPVLYLQLDTPRSTWRLRFDAYRRLGIYLDDKNLFLADRESLDMYPFDVLKMTPHDHMAYLNNIIAPLKPVAVIVDTLRKVHSGDEDNSTNMSNVVSRLIGACHPASLILVSHSRKPSMEGGHDLMADHRGSGSVTGEMDAVLKLTKSRLYFGGRNIEEGHLDLERLDTDGVLMWKVRTDSTDISLKQVLADTSLPTMRAKARALAPKISVTEEAAMSKLRRAISALNSSAPQIQTSTPTIHLG